MKRWWVIAILVSIAWIGLTIGTGVIHTDVVLKGKITQAEDEVISGRYGFACGVGVVAVWIIAYVVYRARSQAKN
jgi:hypothetical protein